MTSNMIAAAAPRPASGVSGSKRWTGCASTQSCGRSTAQQKEPELDVEATKHRLAYIWETEDILGLWLQSWDRVMAGEHRNAMLLYLIATSRLFDNCMHVAIKGPSSGGKSEIRRQVLEFFPPEYVITFTSMSERALLYHKGDFDHKILSMAEAHGFQEKELQDMLLRELMSEGKLTYPVVQKIARSARHAGHHQARSGRVLRHDDPGGAAS